MNLHKLYEYLEYIENMQLKTVFFIIITFDFLREKVRHSIWD